MKSNIYWMSMIVVSTYNITLSLGQELLNLYLGNYMFLLFIQGTNIYFLLKAICISFLNFIIDKAISSLKGALKEIYVYVCIEHSSTLII